jgi:uncharacterized protein YjbI with pentapeptide repeats
MFKSSIIAAGLLATLAVSPANACNGRCVWMNGISLNGVNLNGLKINGVRWNGVRLNGMKLNGIQFNGMRINGVRFNGLRGDDGTPSLPGLNGQVIAIEF